jgi:hypothetical protein
MPYDESKQRLFARPITHPDVAHTEAIIENAKREAASIDRANRPFAYKRDNRSSSASRLQTMHDLAQNNPILRKMLKEFQK